jgi:hypothetical protein
MPLRDVRDFVREHPGQLVFASRCFEEARMHADVAAGQGKGINVRVIDHEERECVSAVIGLGGYAMTDVVDVFGDLRVFDQLSAGADLMHDRTADLCLGTLRQGGVRRAAEVGQIDFCRAREKSQKSR